MPPLSKKKPRAPKSRKKANEFQWVVEHRDLIRAGDEAFTQWRKMREIDAIEALTKHKIVHNDITSKWDMSPVSLEHAIQVMVHERARWHIPTATVPISQYRLKNIYSGDIIPAEILEV